MTSDDTPGMTRMAAAQLNYGLTEHIQLGGGSIVDLSGAGHNTPFAEMIYADGQHNVDVGVAAPQSADGHSWSFDYAASGEWGQLQFSQFKSYVLEQDAFLRGRSVGVRQFNENINWGVAVQEQSAGEVSDRLFSADVGLHHGQQQFNARLNYRNSEQYGLSGIARMTLDDNLFQLQAGFEKSNGTIDRKLNLAWRRSFDGHNFTVNSDYSSLTGKAGFVADYAMDYEQFKFVARAARDHQDQWMFSVGLSTALVWDAPASSLTHRTYGSSSRIVARTYWDKNANGRFDEGDKPLQGVQFEGSPQWRGVKSDKNGRTVLYGARSYHPQFLGVDTGDLDNPFMAPKSEQYRITSHPGGEVMVDIPFYEQFEVEGDVKMLAANGHPEGLANVPVLLMQGDKVVKKTTTEFDGYFLFDDVLPGRYQVHLDHNYLNAKQLQLKEQTPPQLELISGSDSLVMLEPLMLQ